MNAKTLTLAALTLTFAADANAGQTFGVDTLGTALQAGAQPLGAVLPDADGNLTVAHVGNVITTDGRGGATTTVQLHDGDIDDAIVYDFDWAVFPEDISPSMATVVQQTDAKELVGIIIRNTEGALELQPMGVPMETEYGWIDINPVSITQTTLGLALTTRTVDDMSRCCLLGEYHPVTTAFTDSDGYVDFSSAGMITTDLDGDLVETTTSAAAATFTATSTGGR